MRAGLESQACASVPGRLSRPSLALAALALTAASASAGDGFTVLAAKGNGAYVDGSKGARALTVDPGAKKTVYFKVKRLSGSPTTVRFDDAATPDPNPENFKIRWFRGKTNISSDVKGPGYFFTLGDKPRVFRAVLKATGPNDFCFGGQASQTVPSPFVDAAYFKVNGNDCG